MDELDRQILRLLTNDARMTVKDIATHISLTSPAVSQRIKRMEEIGIIRGYTVVLGDTYTQKTISAIINITVKVQDSKKFMQLIENNKNVKRCHHVTGNYSYIIIIKCNEMYQIEKLISEFQQLGQTNTQIILSTPVDRYAELEILHSQDKDIP